MQQISGADFEKKDIRSGTIIDVQGFFKARNPACKLWVDFGREIGIKKSPAQITVHYKKEALLDRQVIAIIYFPPKQIADFVSECLVMGIYDENNDVILMHPGQPVFNGAKIG